MKVFQDLNPRGLASNEYGGITYRCMIKLEEGMTDDQIRHAIYYNGSVHATKYYSWKDGPVNFKMISDQAKGAGINFVVNNSIHLGTPNMSLELFAKTTGIMADLLDDSGWNESNAAIALMNEPGKLVGHGTKGAKKYVEYIKRADEKVNGRYKLWLINDEYHLLDEEYVFTHTTDVPKRVFCPHHLSSLGKTPAWKHVEYAATQAATWGVPVGCSEGGAWFHHYRSETGHAINVKLLEECKKWRYDFCAIVCIDNNEYTIAHTWGTLGYRVWNNDYTTNTRPLDYWNKFVEVIKKYKEGEPPVPEPEDRILRLTEPLINGDDVKECQGHLRRLGFDLYVDGWYGNSQSVPSVKKFQELKGLVQDGAVGPITWKALRETEVADFYPEVYQDIYTKRDYSVPLIDKFLSEYASPELDGHGKFFKLAENTYGEPVEWQLADAWQESVLGTSYHGRTKKNLYGWGITDSGVTSVAYFDTFAQCIDHVAMKVKALYFDEGAPYNNGLHIFGKEVKYSTAPYNAIMKAKYYRKICSIMDNYEEPSLPVPESLDELLLILDERYVKKI